MVTVGVIAGIFYALFMLWIEGPLRWSCGLKTFNHPGVPIFLCFIMYIVKGCAVAMLLLAWRWSSFLRKAGVCVATLAFYIALDEATHAYMDCDEHGLSKQTKSILASLISVPWPVFEWQSMRLTIIRIETLEQSTGRKLGSKFLKLVSVIFTISQVFYTVLIAVREPWAKVWRKIFSTTCPLVYLVFSLIALRGMLIPYWRMQSAVREHNLGKELGWAAKAMRTFLVGEVLLCVAAELPVAVKGLKQVPIFHDTLRKYSGWAWQTCFLLQTIGLLFLSGILQSLPVNYETLINEQDRQVRRAKAREEWRPSEDVDWHDKVKELAGRGFTVEKLLEFYTSLGASIMPHYSPSQHTTNDVVREAIIPLSSESGTSYAEVMMGGKYTLAEKMVTHNWSNLFHDLVACIIADVLETCEFNVVAQLLSHNLPYLRAKIEAEGKTERIYWVCAFSVRQHNSICGANPRGDKDPVTGMLHPICACNRPKFFNATPPLDASGKSISCEMNKFTDMIRYLAAVDPKFSQVVAVDTQFELFNRAWCVAEVAKAHELGLDQQVIIRSLWHLDSNQKDLQNLKIELMQASRPEDVQEILKDIPDTNLFNKHLQTVFFHRESGLVASWKQLSMEQQLQSIGQVVGWLFACEQGEHYEQCSDSDSSLSHDDELVVGEV